ncbi:transglycosylase SLT domain-containing protein [Legionella sp. W05-934-2]|uniref:transglycosylase SLT domain-containing protein n=1 Tax=Legionella sp. W05-934-2 TaxID=1198649 RepID=UPI0034630ED8
MNWQSFLIKHQQISVKRSIAAICLLFFMGIVDAASSPTPAEKISRFEQYQRLKDHLPDTMNDELLFFINDSRPLSVKLRRAWLVKLAEKRDWEQYLKFYQSDLNSTTLQCYAAFAQLKTGNVNTAFVIAKPLWLVGQSQAKACDAVFAELTKQDLINNDLIEERIRLALDKRNIHLARYLLKQLKPPRTEDSELLFKIYQSPQSIKHLKKDSLHDEFYLYGLKRLVSRHMDVAIHLWRQGKSRKLLTEKQQQAFLAHVALYKAIRDHQDAEQWFKMVNPESYNDVLLDWQIRHALKHKHWQNVLKLLKHVEEPESPSWQYWQARALKGLDKNEEANKIFVKLAKNRHYYGFLASIQIKQPFQFESGKPLKNINILMPYKSILHQIEHAYQSENFYTASSMINDFASELNNKEQRALAFWAAKKLKWYGKSVYLSNANEELNDFLTLRFPLAYQQEIKKRAAKYNITPAFIYAIIRQESAFNHRVVSSAGARGLMQVMPNTALMVSKKDHIPYTNRNELFQSEKNIHLGVAYLNRLNQRFKGHPTLIAAAYNAGPYQVNRWLKNHTADDMDIWIETLPFHETRNYLKNIIAYYAVYQYRMKEKPQLKPFLKPVNTQ